MSHFLKFNLIQSKTFKSIFFKIYWNMQMSRFLKNVSEQ